MCASECNFNGFCLVLIDLHDVFLRPLICLISCHLQLAVTAVRGARLPERGIVHVLSGHKDMHVGILLYKRKHCYHYGHQPYTNYKGNGLLIIHCFQGLMASSLSQDQWYCCTVGPWGDSFRAWFVKMHYLSIRYKPRGKGGLHSS